MEQLDEAASAAIRDAVRRFLHADCIGCRFAYGALKSGEGASWVTLVGRIDGGLATDLSSVLDQAEANGELAILIYPRLRRTEEILAVINALRGSPRWSVDETKESPNTYINLFWTNSDREQVSIMGMAPLLSMPVTRRAPYVCMIAWPGPRKNKFRRKRLPEIGIGDMPPPPIPDGETYRGMRLQTSTKVIELNEGQIPPGVTFRLSPREI